MVAVTYDVARRAAAAKAAGAAAPRKSWFARFMDALIEARMAQARREIALHTRSVALQAWTSAETVWSRPVPTTCRSAAGKPYFSPAKPPRFPRPGRFRFHAQDTSAPA